MINDIAINLLKDQFYRLNNLYYITDKNGKKIKFRMTREQLEYYKQEWHKNVILKLHNTNFCSKT